MSRSQARRGSDVAPFAGNAMEGDDNSSVCSARDFLDSKFTIIMRPAAAQGDAREPAAETEN
jgi:hypothetical protein